MIVVDTNIWARAFLGDHPDQAPRARQALASARRKEGVFVPLVVLAELSKDHLRQPSTLGGRHAFDAPDEVLE